MSMASLDGLTAIVIGGHSGFGEAISRTFAAQGASVVIGGRRVAEVTAMAQELGGHGVECDITNDDDVSNIVAAAVAATGRLDIFVNCAGFEQSTPIAELTPELLQSMLDVQLIGAMYCLRHAGNTMRELGNGGSFISISSLTAQNPARGLAAYASAKAGLEYATKIAAVEYGDAGIRFNCVAASLIETPMTAQHFTSGPAIQALTEATPLGRMGDSQDIANASLFLASDLGSFVTGQTLCVDGGASLTMLPTMQMYADVGRRWMEAQDASNGE